MKIVEDFILAHPYLMHSNLFRYPAVIGFAAFAFVTLGMAFGKGKIEKELPWSSPEGKSMRLCWIFMACFFVFAAYDKWNFPESKDFSNPVLAYGLSFLWVFLLVLATFFAVKKQKRDKQANTTTTE